jgi:23S rRNA pseudouridine1911/1915/1917 synthase
MQSINHCLVGDPVYGRKGILKTAALSQELLATLKAFGRQALHAARLGLIHPATGVEMRWSAELPADMKYLLEALRGDMAAYYQASDEFAEDDW